MVAQKYKKKAVVIEAVQYSVDKINDIVDFVGEENVLIDLDGARTFIRTLDGDMPVSEGDYVIKEVNGGFYTCKPDIFEKTYEKDN